MDVNSVSIAIEKLKPFLFRYLVEEEIIPGRNGGTREQFLCPNPDHDDSTPSAHILPGGIKGFCFGCSRTFDLFQVHHWIKGVSLTGLGFITNNLMPLCERFEVEFEIGELDEEAKFKLDSSRAYRMAADFISGQLWSDLLNEYIVSRGLDVEFCRKNSVGD